MMAVAATEIVPAVAKKPPVVAPNSKINEDGTDSCELLLESPTVAPAGAGPESVTVQLVDCPVARLVGVHTKLVSVGSGGTSWIVAVRDVLL
jgi:hypothetical protein